MNEKINHLRISCCYFLFYCIICCVSCQSTRVSYNGNSATDVRDKISELSEESTAVAVEVEKLRGTGSQLESTNRDIEQYLESTAEHYSEIESILERIREQGVSE